MSKPFHGLKFCSTSVPSELRSEVAHKIKSMGGTHVNNLMSDVNYLIVGDYDIHTLYSEKYKFCVKKRDDVGFLKPESIFKIHEFWLDNHDDLIEIEKYELKFGHSLSVCMSRISLDEKIRVFMESNGMKEISEFRAHISHLLRENGAEVGESLTTTSSLVITNENSGKRYNVAKKWNIATIHPLWVIDSHRRRVPLELQYYEFDKLPVTKIGVGACEVWDKLDRGKKRKFEEPDEELVIKKKDPKLWKSIMVEQKRKIAHKKTDEWEEPQDEQLLIPAISKSKLLSTKEIQSNLFAHRKFYLKFFTMTQFKVLRKVIKSHNGTVIDNVDDSDPQLLRDLDFVIIPSDFERTLVPRHFEEYENLKVMTEWFIERSLHYSKIMIDQWGEPFYKPIDPEHIPENPLRINITGFQGIELLHLKKIIKNFMSPGFELIESLNKTVDLLVLNVDILKLPEKNRYLHDGVARLKSPIKETEIPTTSLNSTKTKMKFAKQNSIPIVTLAFIFEFFTKKSSSSININFKGWCMYCPQLNKINPRIINHVFNDDIPKVAPKENSIPKLPSPIRNKRITVPERIYGRAPVSQLNSLESNSAPNYDNSLEDEEEDLRATQISYGNDNENEKLLSLLKGEKYRPNKPVEDTRAPRTTRGKFKEMMGLNEDI